VIAYLEGKLVERGTEVVVAVGDGSVGLNVLVSSRGADLLPPVGQTVKLWTHLAIREDSWVLYGFPSQEERTMFRLLITVSGIGPKLALGILSGASPADLAVYLSSGDEKSLARLPGIGRKSAARLIVELGQRLPNEFLAVIPAEPSPSFQNADVPNFQNAIAVLSAMGLQIGQAEKALLTAAGQDQTIAEDLEHWVRAALRHL
jgi:Holliday junction DNA helicase RuvA